MNFRIWELIRAVFLELAPLRVTATNPAPVLGDLLALRATVRNRLEVLRDALLEQYAEREVYHVLFPIVAQADELVKTLILDQQHIHWPALQHELYQLEDAGDVFFEVLDSALSKPETPPLIFEVFLFCLNDGFRGRYSSNADKLGDYRRRLLERIPVAPLAFVPHTPMPLRPAPWRVPAYLYYVLAAGTLLACYGVLSTMASAWQAQV